MVEMEVVAVQPEPNSNHPLVWLKDKAQRYYLPIAIGNFEATAIFMALHNDPPPRPIAYDLLESILSGFDVKVDQIVIHALKDETFFAEITLIQGDVRVQLDSRPSDAIALALRLKAPIWVAEEVIAEAALPVETAAGDARAPGPIADLSGVEEPSVISPAVRHVDALRAELLAVVAREEYEEAARLRDEIDRLEPGGQNR
jgi:uncharacterized protein